MMSRQWAWRGSVSLLYCLELRKGGWGNDWVGTTYKRGIERCYPHSQMHLFLDYGNNRNCSKAIVVQG